MISAKPAICLAITLAYSLVACPSPAGAQMFAAESNDLSQIGFDVISDVFVGNGSSGPYMLSWKNIESETDNVLITGRKLVRGQEYTIDYGSGMLAFAEPVADRTMVRVSYHKLSNKAVKNGGELTMPLNAKLVDGDRGSLQMLGFYRGGGVAQNSGSGLSVFGLSGDRKIGDKSGLSTTLLFSPGNSNSPGDPGDFLDRTALKLGADTSIGKFALKGNLTRTGQGFSAAKEYNLQSAKEGIDLIGTYGKASDVVFASFSYKEQDNLGAQAGGQANQEQKVVINLPNMPTLAYSHVENETEAKDGKTSGVSTDTYSLNHKLGDKTSVSASFANSDNSSNGLTTSMETTKVAIQSSALKNIQLTSNLNLRNSEKTGEETAYDVAVKLDPTKRTSVHASFANVDSEINGQRTKTAVGVTTTPIEGIQLRTDLVMNANDAGQTDTRLDVGIKAVSGTRFNMDAAYTGTESVTAGQTGKAQVKIAANPIDAVQLQTALSMSDSEKGTETGIDLNMKAKFGQIASIEGSYGDKQSDFNAEEQRQSLRLSAKPTDFLSISAGMGQKTLGDSEQMNRDAKLEIAPSDRFKLATGYSEAVNGEAITTICSYSGQVKPLSFMEMSGNYKTRDTDGSEEIDTTSVKMALGSSKRFKLTGQYAYNPEDDKGKVRRVTTTALGLDMKLGIVGVTGAYSENEEYLSDRLTRETRLGLKMPMFGHGNLTTTYKLAEAINAAAQATTTYTVGYTHIVGASFNLSLAGEMVQYEQDALDNRSDYKATAKLGMSF